MQRLPPFVLFALVALLATGRALAAAPPAEGRVIEHRGERYRVVTLDLHRVHLDLTGQGAAQPHRFADLALGEPDLLAATNAGLFHAVDDPVGLWVEDGVVLHPVERGEGQGNFFLAPNGVFRVGAGGASILATEAFDDRDLHDAWTATQSGPMLVIDGALHPALRPDSRSTRVRSAVGVSDPWTVHLVLSEGPVRFHDLATLFRDVLACDDALYLDGTISGLLGPDLPDPADRYDVAGFLVATERPAPQGLRDGDLVFQRSRSAQAAAIAAATGSPYTHVGLVRIEDGEPWVVEAVQPVQRTPFAAWARRGRDAEVVVRRHVHADRLWTQEALARLDALTAAWLGRPYDRLFAPGDEALYCSELVREAYLGATGLELAPLRPVASYETSDPALRRAMLARWGVVPDELMVVAPSDLLDAPGLVPVPW